MGLQLQVLGSQTLVAQSGVTQPQGLRHWGALGLHAPVQPEQEHLGPVKAQPGQDQAQFDRKPSHATQAFLQAHLKTGAPGLAGPASMWSRAPGGQNRPWRYEKSMKNVVFGARIFFRVLGEPGPEPCLNVVPGARRPKLSQEV